MAAAIAVAAGVALGFGASPASAQEASCHTHGAYYNDGAGGHGRSNGTTVELNPFNPAWEQDHWESLTLRGLGGEVLVKTHPAPGIYFLPNVVALKEWTVCKGYDHQAATTTTAAPATTVPATVAPTTTVTATTAPAPAVPGQPTTSTPVALGQPEMDLTTAEARLPETGSSTWGLLGAGGMLVGIGWTLLRIRRSPA
jgi:LPXTG-motif cell wall-anchored protein